MTPKEKAQELVDEFHYQICNDNGISENDSTEACAKQCALIAVYEIMPSAKYIDSLQRPFLEEGDTNWEEYWNQVKTEINNL